MTDRFGGRGHDFRVVDKESNANGGMLVIATPSPSPNPNPNPNPNPDLYARLTRSLNLTPTLTLTPSLTLTPNLTLTLTLRRSSPPRCLTSASGSSGRDARHGRSTSSPSLILALALAPRP